jgi:hypothetical protein
MLQNFFVGKNFQRYSHCSCGGGAGAARLALQPQQPRYLGEFAETAETPAICLELPIPATPF